MATFEFKLPDLGEGVVEGEIVKWLVKPGDAIEEDQGVVELMTDKATVTVPAPRAGKVISVHGKEGEIAKVHHTLLTMETAGGAPVAAAAAAHAASPAPAASSGVPLAARAVETEK
ncbi:MAG: biotin/lipoyl-containing protein, partial [Myxococcaceae bacterium]